MTASAPEVVTSTGVVRGHRRRGGAPVAFEGIPYARPPVGELRFAPPADRPGWTGVLDCDRPGPAAVQPPSRMEPAVGPIRVEQSEDCLSLNVWTPGLQGSRPVLVWLHGGAFTTGSGGQDWYRGESLARQGDLVVVTVNYRLGALGYLCLPGLSEGNLGLLDQLAALRWVRDNIAGFGGDPRRVTLAGQSAGASSALAMLSAPQAAGLFQRVVLQSTPTGAGPGGSGEAAEAGLRYLRALGVRPGGEHKLRELPAGQLLKAQVDVTKELARPLHLAPPFQLVAAEGLVAEDPVEASRPAGVPRLVTYTTNEASVFTVPDPRLRGLDEPRAVDLARGLLGDAAEAAYAAAAEEGSTPLSALTRLLTDHYFLRDLPALAAAPARTFRFGRSPAGSPLGACHCIELPFVFGTLDAWREAPMLAGATEPELSEWTGEVQATWTAFVHGVP